MSTLWHIAIAGLWLVGAGYALHNYYDDPAYIKYANWPAAMGHARQYVTVDDVVIQLSVDPAFGYYYDLPALNIALPSYPAQTTDDIQARLHEYTTGRKSVWLMGQTFPDWPNYGVVESWMNDHFQSVLEMKPAGIHIQQFMPWTVSDDEIEATPLATFGDIAELVGAKDFQLPDGERTVWLYWRALKPSDLPLKVFVHLEGMVYPTKEHIMASQDDQYLQNGRVGTDSWQLGTVYRDVYNLPASPSPLSSYTISVGMYEEESGNRLLTETGDDHVDIVDALVTILPR